MQCLLTVLPLGTFFSDHNSKTALHQPCLEMLHQSGSAKWTKARALLDIQHQLHTGISGVDPLPAWTR